MFVLVCAVFLFIPVKYLKYFGLDSWAIRFRPYFAVVFLVSTILLVGQTIQYFYRIGTTSEEFITIYKTN